MPKKCPPGVLCIENMTFTIVIAILGMILLFIYKQGFVKSGTSTNLQSTPISDGSQTISFEVGGNGLFPMPSYSYSITPDDVLMNPYEAPLRDNRIFNTIRGGDPRGIPINIPTQSVDTNYRQIGILTRINGPETILPLMGRPLFTNRDKWNFYTMSDKNNMIKLPVVNKGKSCTGEYGCDNLQSGDTVYVEGYNDAFKVTAYDNNQMRYIPYV